MDSTVSPLAPASLPGFPSIGGVSIATAECGVKYRGRDDLLVVNLDQGSVAAGVFTVSTAAGAPVVWSRECLSSAQARGLVVNAGNANVFTGEQGRQDVEAMATAAAELIGCSPYEVFVASTGVIGEPLPLELILPQIKSSSLNDAASQWQSASRAILTTDTFAKGATRTVQVAGTAVRINGMAKGSGMIEPDMATMLAFVFTDASIEKSLLQSLLRDVNDGSFNSITVDSDTSTSDTCMLFASGAAGNAMLSTADSDGYDDFRQGLSEVMHDLALQVVRDGEGATKLIQVSVAGAADDVEAKHVSRTIANSPLVKTAIAGEDANWGRVVMAIGKSGVHYEDADLGIAFGGIAITENGRRADHYNETEVTRHLQGQEVSIEVTLGNGAGKATVWTCDLTHGYITINADYRS